MNVAKAIWNAHVTSKMNLFAWTRIHQKLKTNDLLWTCHFNQTLPLDVVFYAQEEEKHMPICSSIEVAWNLWIDVIKLFWCYRYRLR